MLAIARHTDYAARLVLHLAALGEDAQVSMREIAEARRMPLPFVRRIVGKLVRTGILVSVRGAAGGLRLGRPADDISLLDIVDAMEGGVELNRCVHGAIGCPLASSCPIQCVWARVNEDLRLSLAGTRFDVLARNQAGHAEAHQELQRRANPRRKKPAA